MPDVLVIEDDAEVRALLPVMLEAEGLAVRAAADGREGLAMFRAEPPRVVVTDLRMPKMDGLEVIQVFRRLAPDVRVIAVSGGGAFDPAGPLEEAEHLGAHATLEKPFTAAALVARVRSALG